MSAQPGEAETGADPHAILLERLLTEDHQLRRLQRYVRRRMATDAAHDDGHLRRVAYWTLRLGGDGIDTRSAVAAALLHDLVNVPKHREERARANELSADAARELLPRLGFGSETVEEIAVAIRDHSFSRGAAPASPLGRALQDADRLDALGVVGTFRCLATGVAMGAAFFDAGDPWGQSRELDDSRFSVDHFFTKLLRLPATMQTENGRTEAERRAAVMREVLRELGREIGVPTAD